MKKTDWYAVLLAARRVFGRGDELTSSSLAEASGIPTKVASAWLSNFYHWGYALRAGKVAAGGRWTWRWRLTRWGLEYKRRRGELRIAANPGRQK